MEWLSAILNYVCNDMYFKNRDETAINNLSVCLLSVCKQTLTVLYTCMRYTKISKKTSI